MPTLRTVLGELCGSWQGCAPPIGNHTLSGLSLDKRGCAGTNLKSKKSPEPRSFLDQGERNAYELETLHKASRKIKHNRKAKDYIA